MIYYTITMGVFFVLFWSVYVWKKLLPIGEKYFREGEASDLFGQKISSLEDFLCKYFARPLLFVFILRQFLDNCCSWACLILDFEVY